MNDNTNTTDKENKLDTSDMVSEYKIGHATYIVKTYFKHNAQERLEDILKRLIIRDSERMLDEKKSKI